MKSRANGKDNTYGAAELPRNWARPCDVVTGLTGTKKVEEANPSHFSLDIAEEIHLTIELNGVEIVP